MSTDDAASQEITEEMTNRVFDTIDENRNGYITVGEYLDFLQAHGEVSEEALDDFTLSTDGSGTVSRQDFHGMVVRWRYNRGADSVEARTVDRIFRLA